MHRFPLVAAALALSAGSALAQPITLTPQQIGQVFCIARLGNDMAPVEGLLTAGLTAAIADAEMKNDVIQKAHPDEKPPLGDGLPWQAFPDYADQCRPGAVTFMMDEAHIAIDYAFKDYPDADFSDTLALKLVDDPFGTRVWRIDNVVYAGDGDLRTALTAAFLD
jgi:hypothetical protein